MGDQQHLARCIRILDLARRRNTVQTADAVALLGEESTRVRAKRAIKALEAAGYLRRVGEGIQTAYEADEAPRTAEELLETELLALQIGVRALSFLEGTEMPDWSEEALASMISLSSPEVVGRLRRVDARFRVLWEPSRSFARSAALLEEVLDALRFTRRMRIRYRDERHEHFEPLALVLYRRGLYLLGRDMGSQLIHRFAFDRITEAKTTRTGFVYPATDEFDLDAELEPWFGIRTGPEPEPVHVRFHPRVAHYVRSRRWHPTAEVADGEDGWVDLKMTVGGIELVRWVLEWGETAVVVDPPWLRERVLRELRGALARYEGSAPEGSLESGASAPRPARPVPP